jgi:hypothetical protein
MELSPAFNRIPTNSIVPTNGPTRKSRKGSYPPTWCAPSLGITGRRFLAAIMNDPGSNPEAPVERIDEIENPESAMGRTQDLYEKKPKAGDD